MKWFFNRGKEEMTKEDWEKLREDRREHHEEFQETPSVDLGDLMASFTEETKAHFGSIFERWKENLR